MWKPSRWSAVTWVSRPRSRGLGSEHGRTSLRISPAAWNRSYRRPPVPGIFSGTSMDCVRGIHTGRQPIRIGGAGSAN